MGRLPGFKIRLPLSVLEVCDALALGLKSVGEHKIERSRPFISWA